MPDLTVLIDDTIHQLFDEATNRLFDNLICRLFDYSTIRLFDDLNTRDFPHGSQSSHQFWFNDLERQEMLPPCFLFRNREN